jgi:hypothetical protein
MSALGRGLDETEAKGGERLAEQLALALVEVAGGLLLKHGEGIYQGLRHLAGVGTGDLVGTRRKLAAQGLFRLVGESENE